VHVPNFPSSSFNSNIIGAERPQTPDSHQGPESGEMRSTIMEAPHGDLSVVNASECILKSSSVTTQLTISSGEETYAMTVFIAETYERRAINL